MKKFLAILLTMSMLPFSFVSAGAAVLGDVDGDGKLTASDVSAVIQNILSGGEYIAEADADGNGVINSADAACILQKVLDGNYTMPGEEATEVTTEEITETTTEEITETTTEAVTYPDDYITSDYELIPANFADDKYFTAVGGLHSSTDANKIRVTKTNGISFKVAEGANIYINAKHASSSTDDIRPLILSNESGTVATHEYTMVADSTQTDPGEEILFAAGVAAGTYTIMSGASHINVYSVRITFEKIDQQETTTEATTEFEVPMEVTTTGNRVDVTDFSSLVSAVAQKNVDVYVLNDIDCTSSLRLSSANANVNIIGVTQADGSSPSLNFAAYTNSFTSDPGEGGTGIRVSGSYYSFENLIVENAGNCGMRIKGTRAGHCLVKDCVFRYNNNSGISVTSGGEYNSFVGVDCYRNGDIIQNYGDDADGFSVKVNAGDENHFYNCRAWDNSDDGWDSFDKDIELGIVGKITYKECLAWHNGQQESFTGEYDYRMNYPLDKNLTYVKTILANDPDFEAKYNNKEVTEWPKLTMTLMGCSRSYDELYSNSWGGNPNGFKFGSVYTPNTSYRYIENCIAFDNTGKGYDQNNAKAQFDLVNGISFDNGRNYLMAAMTPLSVTGTQYGFGGSSSDSVPSGMEITTPSTEMQETIRNTVHAYRDSIFESLRNDIIPGVVLCEIK